MSGKNLKFMILISYDIEDDRLRLKISKRLHFYGLHRIQYSVFMGTLANKDVPKLKTDLMAFSQQKAWAPQDTILILPVHDRMKNAIEILGQTPPTWPEIAGELHTLML